MRTEEPGERPPVSAEQRLRLLVDAVEEYAIFILSPTGEVATWNPGAERIKGYTADEVVGRHFSVFYPADDVAAGKPERELAAAIAEGQCRDEGLRVRKDGTTFWANVVISAMFDDDQQLVGFAKITRDDTDRKEAEEHMRRLELLTDRERIADELRESLIHRIFETGLQLEGTMRLISDPVAKRRVGDVLDQLDEMLKEIRAVVLDLNNVS